jgi:CRISPR-associated protein (TIGR03984 family)
MSPSIHDNLTEALICTQLQHVTNTQAAWLLLQEPGFIGFGVVQQDAVHWPPDMRPDWSRIADLRLFGEKGEWHAWSHWDHRWQSRLLQLQDVKDCLIEYHALWGTQAGTDVGTWLTLTEGRGTALWLPVPVSNADLPLRLKLAQVVDYDDRNGLAGIVDAALIALVSASEPVKVFAPPINL